MLDPLYHLAANAIVFFHKGLGPVFGQDSFFSWALSVVLLVVSVRILIFPLFVRQVKSQRTMQMMQPRIKEIREKYSNDKPKMQAEIMALQKEHGNPLLGCAPILLQIPLFISLFHVFTHLRPIDGANGTVRWVPRVGLSADTIQQIAHAKLWGVSLSTDFNSSESLLTALHANATHIKIVAVVLILLMGATTFLTQKQIMARTGPTDPQQAMVQKVLLYGSPIMLAVFGFRFPVAVLLYWLTTNLWSLGQQFFVIKKMPPVLPLTAGGKSTAARATAVADRPAPARPAPGARAGAKAKGRPRPTASTAGAAGTTGTTAAAATEAQGAVTGSGAGRTSSSAPAGTRSPRGSARNRATPAVATLTKSEAAPTNGAAESQDDAAAPVTAAAGASAGNGAGSGTSKTGGGSPGDAERSGSPVPAGTTRHVGGSRPAKKRGKGKRPGGRR